MGKVFEFAKKQEQEQEGEIVQEEGFDFSDIIKKNQKNEDRINKERSKHNKGITRGFKLRK